MAIKKYKTTIKNIIKEDDEYYTPLNIYQKIANEYGLSTYDYDPFTTSYNAERLNISQYDTIETDGFKTDWGEYNHIFINPPFTRKFEAIEKAVNTINDFDNRAQMISIIIPSESISTKKFYELTKNTEMELILFDGRIKFEKEDGEQNHPSFSTSVVTLFDPTYYQFNGKQLGNNKFKFLERN